MDATVKSDNSEPVRAKRRRRTPAASRDAMLVAAQLLLSERGPAGVTLKAVADATSMTHGNVTHHFGSSAMLQAALIARMATDLTDRVGEAAVKMRAGALSEQGLVDVMFDGFRRDGYARLIAWFSAAGQTDALAPIFTALENLIRDLRAAETNVTDPLEMGAGPGALSVISMALTASLIGPPLERAAAMPEQSLRRLAVESLRRWRAR
jgi:AcrR family transcriptional regulator